MFKVSLLPESYRKQLIGKKNRDIILTVALIVFLCMLIVYAGIVIRLLILKTQEKDVQKKNSQIMARIDELSPYVEDYNALAIAEANFANIKPVDITALEMVNTIQKITPDYIQVTAFYAPEWQKNQVCIIEGNLCSANNLTSAAAMLDEYKKTISENETLKDAIKEIKVVNDEPLVEVDSVTGARSYSFRIIVSLSGIINIDQQTGTLVTTTKPETTESTTESTTAPTETEPSTVEPSTIA
ncbi:MAG: hypothetical protein K2G60_06025 [Oscillospiraceae bacterium]|nr:hypothetical protein [Oscillospiraceae bacterium]